MWLIWLERSKRILIEIENTHELIEMCFPKLTQSTFWPNWVKHTYWVLACKLCHLSKTHQTQPQHTPPHPNTPIPTPSDLDTNFINTPTDPPHTPLSPTPYPHPHTQNGYLENKRLFQRLSQKLFINSNENKTKQKKKRLSHNGLKGTGCGLVKHSSIIARIDETVYFIQMRFKLKS